MTPLSELRPLIRSTLVEPLNQAMGTHPSRHPEAIIERIPLTMATHGLPVSLCYAEGCWTVSVSVPLEARGPLEVEGRASTLAKALFQVGNAMLREIEYRECQRRRPSCREGGDESAKMPMIEQGDPHVITPNGHTLGLIQAHRSLILVPSKGEFRWTPTMVAPLLPLIHDKMVLAVSSEHLSIRFCDSVREDLLEALVAAADTALSPHEERAFEHTWRFNATNKAKVHAIVTDRWQRSHRV